MPNCWKAFSKDVPTPFHVQADFNGDGLVDHVWLLLRSSGVGWGLFAFLGSKEGQRRAIKLEEDVGQVPAQHMGVLLVTPGEYDTACGKGYWDCEAGEPEKLKLTLPAIDFFTLRECQFVLLVGQQAWRVRTDMDQRLTPTDRLNPPLGPSRRLHTAASAAPVASRGLGVRWTDEAQSGEIFL